MDSQASRRRSCVTVRPTRLQLVSLQGNMRRLYQVLGWGLVLLGAAHMATTFRAFEALSSAAVWFFGAGIAMALTGALNLLNRAYGQQAPGLHWTCVATNGAMTVFGLLAGIATHASVRQLIVVLGLLFGATLLSASRRALGHPAQRAA